MKRLFLLLFVSLSVFAQTINFKSLDGLKMSADLYLADKNYSKPFIILFHQAGWSIGESIKRLLQN